MICACNLYIYCSFAYPVDVFRDALHGMAGIARTKQLTKRFGIMGMRGRWASFFFWIKIVLASTVLIALVASGVLAAQEMRSSEYQARFFADLRSEERRVGKECRL